MTKQTCRHCFKAITQEGTSTLKPRWWHLSTGKDRCEAPMAEPLDEPVRVNNVLTHNS